MHIVERVSKPAEKHGCTMAQISIAWLWAKGVSSPIIGATKAEYFDTAAAVENVTLTAEEIAYLEEPYTPPPNCGSYRQKSRAGCNASGRKEVSLSKK